MEDLRGAEIRPKKTWRLALNVLLLGVWGFLISGSVEGYQDRVALHRSTPHAIGLIVVAVALCVWFVFVTLKALFYVETVTVTSSTLAIAGRLGVPITNKSYDNATVRNLRYEEWPGGRSGTQNGIRFEYNGETVTFARQADTTESWALIDRMCGAYGFPTPKAAVPAGVVTW